MISRLFLELTEFAWFRRLVWKPVYQMLASKFPTDTWSFMNYGYDTHIHEDILLLQEKDEIHRYAIQHYHFLAVKTLIKGKDVLEVGSGRGGGSHYIATNLHPKSMTGMDLASKAVELCNKNFVSNNLKYITGNAENIPLETSSRDVIINVESCHAYGSVDNFLAEVKRVLRPGGHLLLTDIRGNAGKDLLVEKLLNSDMEIIEEEDITLNVVNAIEKEDKIKWKRIRQSVPRWLHTYFSEFAGSVGSQTHKQLKNRDLVYFRFVLRKRAA
jgi:ubiquinone/menaquinone biosynthesis C-methylase UbiE